MQSFKQKSDNGSSRKRLIPLIALTVAVALVASTVLMKYQIVQAKEFQKQAEQSNQTYVDVKAARGQIVDRYGRVLVTNKLQLNLQIDGELPQPEAGDSDKVSAEKNQKGNRVILNLINLFSQQGAGWIDEFPISATQPYTYLAGQEDQVARLQKAVGVQSFATAQDCLDQIVSEFSIEGYDETQTRQIAGIRGQMLIKEYSETTPYVFAENMDSAFAGKLMEMSAQLPGTQVAETSVREYPSGDIAPHILGTVGPIFKEDWEEWEAKGYQKDAIVGKSGIESAFEEQLRGRDGKLTVVRNKDGDIVDQYYEPGNEPQPGNTVVLTIDANMQKQMQDALASYAQTHAGPAGSAKGAGLSVVDVKTGEALTLASYPSYNINDYQQNYEQLAADTTMKPLMNRPLMGQYRPGSTFKTFMATAAILNGTNTPDTYYNCVDPFPGTQMGCVHSGGHYGMQSVYSALKYSCNHYFYNTAKNMGIDAIDKYAPYFGFATDTGLEITNADGRVTNPNYYEERGVSYLPGFTYQTGIGQAEVYVTPLQMSVCMMTIANHGTRYAAHVVKSIEKYDYSGTVSTTQPEVLSQLPADSVAYDTTLEGMREMAQTRPILNGLDIAAKSGSPQYSDKNTNLTNAAAVGIYPSQNPEIGLGLLIEDGASGQDFFKQAVDIYNSCKQQEVEQLPARGGLVVR